MELLNLINTLESFTIFHRSKTNIKSNIVEQETVTYKSNVPVTVSIDNDHVNDVVQFCIVNENDLFYLYVGVQINSLNNKYSKYLIDDIINISL